MNSFKHYNRVAKFSLFGTKEKFTENGGILFLDDGIVIEEKIILLDHIDFIKMLQFDDYRDKVLKDKVSEGNNNVLNILLKDGKKADYYFQQEYRYQIREIREQLIAYYKAGKFDFDNLTLILGLENYNAIQNFKNTLSIKSY